MAMEGFDFGEFRVVVKGRGRGVRLERAAPGTDGRDGDRCGEEDGPPARLPRRRVSHPHTGAVGTLVGREEQLGLLRSVVRSRRMVEFTAERGSGKTSLLRAVAPDAYVRVGAADFEDFLQDLVREFYVYPPGAPRLSAEECRRALRQVNAVVALDDVGYDPPQIADLREALRGCAVLIGAVRPAVGPLGISHPLPGLAAEDAVTLLSRLLDRIIAGAELPQAHRLVAALDGRPLALRQAAALVRYDDRDLADLVRQVEPGPATLDALAVAALDPQSRRALAALALLGGARLPARLVAAMAEVEPGAERFERLCARGLAEKHGDRFGLPAGLPEPYLRLLHRQLDLRASLRTLGAWIEARDPAGEEAGQAADAAVPLLDAAAGRGDWESVVALATTVEPVLCVQGHWRSWQRTLEIGRLAAGRLPDAAAEAHFAHQEGTLHLLEGRREEARDALSHALELRTRHFRAVHDPAVEDTRANLVLAGGSGDARGGGAAGASRALLGRRLSGIGRSTGRRRRARARRRSHRALVGMAAATAALATGVAVAVGTVGGDGLGGVGVTGRHHSTSAAGAKGGPATSGGLPGVRRSSGIADQDAPSGTAPTEATSPTGPGTALRPLTIEGTADYGDVHAGPAGSAPVATLTITNPNGTPVALEAITLSTRSDFAITQGSCRTGEAVAPGFLDGGGAPAQAKKLAAGTSCSVLVRFAPTALGRRADTLTVSYGKDGRSSARLTGRAFATVKVTVSPDATGSRHGYVDITSDGTVTTCDPAEPCTVRYFDAKAPLLLDAHGGGTDPGGSGGAGDGGTTGAGGAGGSSTTGSTAGADPTGGSSTSDGAGTSAGSSATMSPLYLPGTWTGPCAGAAQECAPTPGGDITTTITFTQDAS
ncbi:hypothetical protein [Actinacidiphila reveromycinica]|uniref:hypothetical protein n=1 Tax=Actinacidiphila reveromycinica TaxID=659352 RepID=UPI0019238F43|nr:hypothetical protein [Streptomyces sp. SN-593]